MSSPHGMDREEGHDCESQRPALIQRAEGASADAHLDAHLAACADCRRDLARAQQRIELARSLPRVAAPLALDGAVVAALQAGARQERAVQAVASLTPVDAPDVLAHRVAIPRAPAVLDRLVAEDLADPARAVAGRYTRRLERLRAPDDLQARLERPAPRRRFLLAQALVVASVVLVAGSLVLLQLLRAPDALGPGGAEQAGRDAAAGASADLVFVVERVDSIGSLDPVAGQLLSGLLGGLPDADRLHREEL